MPRYFFHSENGKLVKDSGGEVLADEAAARREAVRLAGALLADRPENLLERGRWRLRVSEAAKGDLFTVEVTVKSGAQSSDWGA